MTTWAPMGASAEGRTLRTALDSDRLFRYLVAALGAIIVLLLAGLVLQLSLAARPSMEHFGPGFLISSAWDPVRRSFGALPFVYGTLVSSLIALLLATPLALGVAIFLAEPGAQRIKRPLGFLVELLAAVPSVVYGLWGIFLLAPLLREHVQPALASAFGNVPLFRGPPLGLGMLAGGIILAIMILPTVASVSREALNAVPGTYREAALALGATRFEAIRHAVIPHARSGLAGAVVLGLGRALGETMAVTMVIGNRPEIDVSLFAPSYTMASVIANEFTEATDPLHLAALAEIGLILLCITVLLNVAARLLISRTRSAHAGPLR